MLNLEMVTLYIIIPVLVTAILSLVLPFLANRLSNHLPPNKKQLKIIRTIEKNKELIKSLQRYGATEIWIIVVFWLLLIFLSGFILMRPSQPFGFGGFLIFFILLISSLGPSWYAVKFVMIGVYKLFKPNFDRSIMEWYYYNAFNQETPIYLTNLAEKFNYSKLNTTLALWSSVIFAIFLIFALIYSIII